MSKRTSSDSEADSKSAGSSTGENKKHRCENTVEVLKGMLEDKDKRIRDLVKARKVLQQKSRRQQEKIQELQEELEKERKKHNQSLDVERVADKTGNKGVSGSWLTPSGAVSLAVA